MYVLFALISELGFTCLNILNKRLRNRDIGNLPILAMYVFTTPFWLAVIILLLAQNTDIIISSTYLFYVAAWVGLSFLSNIGLLYIFKYQSLSENSGVSFGMNTLIALSADTIIFDIDFNPLKLLFICICITGGVMLSHIRGKNLELKAHLPTLRKLGVIFLLSIIAISMLTVFKKGMAEQPNTLFHIALTHFILFSIMGLFGGKTLHNLLKRKAISPALLALFCFLAIVTGIFGSYAISGLPLAVIIVFSLLRNTIYAIFDLYSKEIPFKFSSIITIFVVLISIAMIALI